MGLARDCRKVSGANWPLKLHNQIASFIFLPVDKLTFYHQKRRDGGVRSGVEFNEQRILERFEPGASPEDSALIWFVDVRCSGENLPSEPDSIRQWFLNHAETIRTELYKLSQELIAGIDSGWPVKKEIAAQGALRMAIYCSAIWRLSGREISHILSGLGDRWSAVIQSLGSYEQPVPVHG